MYETRDQYLMKPRPRPRPITVRPRPRPRPKKWSRDHVGLETLISLGSLQRGRRSIITLFDRPYSSELITVCRQLTCMQAGLAKSSFKKKFFRYEDRTQNMTHKFTKNISYAILLTLISLVLSYTLPRMHACVCSRVWIS